MKNRLIFFALAILCYGHIQAESWFANVRNYTPHQQGSFKIYQPENVSSRLASMRYLYGDDVAQDQEQLTKDYEKYLWDKYLRQSTKDVNYIRAMHATKYLANKPLSFDHSKVNPYYKNRAVSPSDTASDYQESSNYMLKQYEEGNAKCSRIYGWEQNLRPTIQQQEAEMLRPRTFYQYQHPDQYILNN